jgi:hypothetical protein
VSRENVELVWLRLPGLPAPAFKPVQRRLVLSFGVKPTARPRAQTVRSRRTVRAVETAYSIV